MDVAGVQLEGVVQRGVDQLDHAALVFADAGQRQALQRVAFAAGFGVVVKGVHGVEAFFVAGQEGGKVGGMGQVQRCALQHIVDPGQAGVVEGSANTPSSWPPCSIRTNSRFRHIARLTLSKRGVLASRVWLSSTG